MCDTSKEETLKCRHKDAWELLPLEWFGLFFTLVWILACNMAGMGGGGTMVPLIRVLFSFNVPNAIALSNITVFISGLQRYLFDFKKKHPLKKNLHLEASGTLLEYNIAILIMPMGIVGAAVGSIVGLVLPEPILIGVMTVVLSFIAVNMAIMLKNKCKEERNSKITNEMQTKKNNEMNTQIEMNANLASKDQSIPIDEGKQSNEERV